MVSESDQECVDKLTMFVYIHNRMLYGGTASSWDLVPRCRA